MTPTTRTTSVHVALNPHIGVERDMNVLHGVTGGSR
jgi:hypothetical protein